MLYTNDRVTIRFDGGIEVSRPWLAADASRAQRVLGNHSQERALCMCTPAGVPMHIVCRGGNYHLATMPGRSHYHALSCPSYQPDTEYSGLRHYQASAFAGNARCRKLRVSTTPLGEPPYDHFSPSAALEMLWESAGLTVCTPKTVEKRNYYFVLKSIERISGAFRINDQPIRPYLPLLHTDPSFCHFVIAQVRRINHGQYGNAVLLSGDREHAFWVDQSNWDGSPLADRFGPFESPSVSRGVFLLARLWRSKQGNFRLFDVGLLPTSRQFLPTSHVDVEVLDALIEKDRRFFVCQRFDAMGDDSIPSLVLVDRESPLPVHSAASF